MECPNCRIRLPDGSTECPGCSIVFAKWKAKAAAASGTTPADAKECPSCHTQQPAEAAECTNCLIVFAQWQVKAKTVAASESMAAPDDDNSLRWVFPVLSGTLAALWAGFALWPVTPRTAPEANAAGSALITFRNGEKCLVGSPVFEYERRYSVKAPTGWRYINTTVSNVSIDLLSHQNLRAGGVGASGVDIPLNDIRELRFISDKTMPSPGGGPLTGVELVPKSGKIQIIPVATETMLLPDPNCVWEQSTLPGWENFRYKPDKIFLKGRFEASCGKEKMDLTAYPSDSSLIPIRVEFR